MPGPGGITAKLVGMARRLSRTVSDDVCCTLCVALLARGIAGHGHDGRSEHRTRQGPELSEKKGEP
ncbi:hypothetical protein SBADM41S_11296 [Streptomyces badius]